MKTIFISLPMNGRDKKEIQEEMNNIYLDLNIPNSKYIDSVFDLWENKDPMYYLWKSIKLMSSADYVCFWKWWHLSRWCNIEYQIAKAYGKDIIFN